MSKLHIAAAAATTLLASLGSAGMASAGVATFEGQATFRCDSGVVEHDGGLAFANTFAACFYSPGNPADFPTPPPSTVMGVGFSDTVVTRDDSSTFSLNSVELAFGPFQHGGATSDTTLVTGSIFGGGTLSTTLTVGYGFQTFNFSGWDNLTSVTFGQLAQHSEYLAFDNVTYDGSGAVPEPAGWALMIGGFGLAGAALRRRRVVEAA